MSTTPGAPAGTAATVPSVAPAAAQRGWCPASGSIGDFRCCPGCGRAVSPRRGSVPTVPRHKLPAGVAAADASTRLDDVWAAISRTQAGLARRR